MKFNLTKSLIAAAMAMSASAAMAAAAGTAVTIQEGAIAGTPASTIVADQLSGQYDEVVTFTSATTFVSDAIFNAGNWFFSGQNIAGGTYLGAKGDTGYNLYAKFSSTGTYTTSASGNTFTTNTATIELWADANADTKYNVKSSATGNINNLTLTSGSTADDVLLGTATALQIPGTGNNTAGGLGQANGNFELLFSAFTLANPNGLNYFILPRPFNLALDLNGNFQNFVPVSGNSIQLLNNSANAFFLPNAVPEPGALALAGIALVGAAVATRRKNKA